MIGMNLATPKTAEKLPFSHRFTWINNNCTWDQICIIVGYACGYVCIHNWLHTNVHGFTIFHTKL